MPYLEGRNCGAPSLISVPCLMGGGCGASGAPEPGVRVFWKVNGGGTKCKEKFY